MDRDQTYPDRDKLDIILRLSHLLSTSIRIEDVLNNAMKGLEKFLKASDSSIYEIDYETGELFFRLARGDKSEHLTDKRLKIGSGIAGFVAQTGKPKIVFRTEDEERFFDGFDRESGYQTYNMLCVPLISKGQVTGVIQVLNKANRRPFNKDDLELAQIMAGRIAVSLENAKLYQRLEEKQKATEAELAHTQKKLIRTQRQAALSGLATGIAHQIRNPTTSIGGFARRILEKTPPEQNSLRRYAEVIVQESRRLEELVKRVVFLTGMAPNPILTDINDIAVKAQATGDRRPDTVKLITRLTPNLPLIHVDPVLLEAALEEILNNALEAGAETVMLRTRTMEDFIHLEIIDDGPGLTEEDVTSATDPFFSTKAHSLGLGLSIVSRVVEEHFGEIDIHSGHGKGCRIALRFPVQIKPIG